MPETMCGESAALVIALQETQATEELVLTITSEYLRLGLTKDLQKWEDRGWIGVQNKELSKKAAAELRKRSDKTIFRRAAKGEQGPENFGATVIPRCLAERGVDFHWASTT